MAAKSKEEKNIARIKEIRKEEANKVCFICEEKGPAYVCTTFHTFVCTSCSGIHREFAHRVKSITMANFTDDEVEHVAKGGNAAAKKMYLGKWDPKVLPKPDPSDKTKVKQFIERVFEKKEFYKTEKDKDKKKEKEKEKEKDSKKEKEKEKDSKKKKKKEESSSEDSESESESDAPSRSSRSVSAASPRKEKEKEKKKEKPKSDDVPPVRDLKTVIPNVPKLVVKKVSESEESSSDSEDEEERQRRKKERKEKKKAKEREREQREREKEKGKSSARKPSTAAAPAPAPAPAKKPDLIDLDAVFSSGAVTSHTTAAPAPAAFTESWSADFSEHGANDHHHAPAQAQAPAPAPAAPVKSQSFDPFADLMGSIADAPTSAAAPAAPSSANALASAFAPAPAPMNPYGMPAGPMGGYPPNPYGYPPANPYGYAAAYPGYPPNPYGAAPAAPYGYDPNYAMSYYGAAAGMAGAPPTAAPPQMTAAPPNASPPAASPDLFSQSRGPPPGPNWGRPNSMPGGPAAQPNMHAVNSQMNRLGFDDGNPFS